MKGEKGKINDYRQRIVALGMGTSNQIDVSDEQLKRSSSLHKQGAPDKIVELADGWKTLGKVPAARKNTMQRIFEPASNVHREKEEGCMNKIKLERSLKLRAEEQRGRKFNPLTGAVDKEEWIHSYGDQVNSHYAAGKRAVSSNPITHQDMKEHWKSALASK